MAIEKIKKVLTLDKKEGETPLEALDNFRFKNKKYKDVKLTYAGRLDPMASGLLLVLAGEETKKKEKYLKLGKEYDFSVLFGFATDTYDILGKITSSAKLSLKKEIFEKIIKQNLKYFTGKFVQDYPVYSSKTVKGKSLFEYARGDIDVDIPSKKVFVKELTFLKVRRINNAALLNNIEKRIKKVKGDFRQAEILKIWKKNLSKKPGGFFIADFKIKCGSGTYVRGIVNSLGDKICIPALAFSIKRTKVGKHWKI